MKNFLIDAALAACIVLLVLVGTTELDLWNEHPAIDSGHLPHVEHPKRDWHHPMQALKQEVGK